MRHCEERLADHGHRCCGLEGVVQNEAVEQLDEAGERLGHDGKEWLPALAHLLVLVFLGQDVQDVEGSVDAVVVLRVQELHNVRHQCRELLREVCINDHLHHHAKEEPNAGRSGNHGVHQVATNDVSLLGRDLARHRDVLVGIAVVALGRPHIDESVLHLHTCLLAQVEVSLIRAQLEEHGEVARHGLQLLQGLLASLPLGIIGREDELERTNDVLTKSSHGLSRWDCDAQGKSSRARLTKIELGHVSQTPGGSWQSLL
mmetsp:Transcript_7440/g.31533  ORF Transcript_7440/g.31533 Transcript_7440/m.31533 type:complete len:259 (-) Transcript_7440:7-783(-)